MRIVYFEPFSGISGDMVLGALLDLGLELETLQHQLNALPLRDYGLSSRRCSKAGIRAIKFDVNDRTGAEEVAAAHHSHTSYREIRNMIQSSPLSAWVKGKSLEAFRRLAEAEAKIHDRDPEEVQFHEVGAVDSIVDIVGCMIGLERFLPATFLSAPVNVGQGTLRCQHGIYPAPGPATEELLKGIPTYSDAISGELTTPTGATLLATLVERFGPRPLMRIEGAGYGAGSRDLAGVANVLRITIGEEIRFDQPASAREQVAVIEATIDDMNPQIYGYFQERAFEQGALDVYATPVQMKKNRPAMELTVVCTPESVERLSRLIFAETTTIGIRYTIAERKTLQRQFAEVQTEYGPVTIKVSSLDGRRMNFVPEYEDCRRLAVENDVALKEVQAAAVRAYLQSAAKSIDD
jgi:pyridinium-3,5-bisthiocarboxylic acid mononucleotide nickel chelatase